MLQVSKEKLRALGMCGVSAIVLAASLAGAAHAQTPAEESGLEDIIVTARKVEERLQDVPVSVTAFSGDQLEKRNIVQISEVAAYTPGFSIRPHPGNPTAVTLQIRGQVQNDILATLEPSVGTYVDEMYWGRAYGLTSAMIDMASVQVLKGPQGTLFGRNTTGGALLVTSNNPQPDEFSGRASGTYGRFNEATAEIMLNLPVSSQIALRGAFRVSQRDGWAYGVRQYNLATGLADNSYLAPGLGEVRADGTKFGGRKELNGRLKALVEFNEDTQLLLSGEWFAHKSDGAPRQLRYKVALNDSTSAGDNVAFRTAAMDYLAYEATHPNASGGDGFNCNYAVTAVNCQDNLRTFDRAAADIKTQTYIAKLTSDLNFGSFKLIGGYRKIVNDNLLDLDGSAALIHATQQFQNLDQWSLEGQLTGSLFEDKFDYAIGATYFTEGGTDYSYSLTTRPGGDRRNNATRNYAEIDNKSYGIYGQASYHFTDALTFTGGLRYSNDRKGIDIRSANVGMSGQLQRLSLGLPLGTLPLLDDPCNAAGNNTPGQAVISYNGQTATAANDCSVVRSDTFDAVSWTAGLDFKFNPDFMVYGKISRGYRSGGQNLRAFNSTQFVPFEPESLTEMEAGIKSEFLDGRARLNVAIYRNILENAQVSILQTSGAVSNTLISNAAKVRNMGVEADFQIQPINGLTLGASGSINDATYLRYTDAGGDRSGDNFILRPKYLASLTAQYETQINDATSLALGVDWTYSSKSHSDRCTVTGISACWDASKAAVDALGNTREQISQAVYNANIIDAAGILGARVTVGFNDDAYQLSFWGKNITNNRGYTQNTALMVPYRNYVGSQRREPTTYGLTASAKF